ncbi:M56 family metallopeptidase [Caproicibacter fermentans]|uniref:M56 family metallopeptidase n=1 Tax=Caproicibacter fermentans TaxID=2576756 RepID=A0A7G8TFE8_9FIRM|nr:M56 family metallopeptidase [Caproicibacter fermentans]QNK42339.1 M56 family metallopeptidase [Caproicibacter fermentans]
MWNLFIIWFECSVTMSALVLALLALAPLLSKRYAAKWIYYTWLVPVAGLIIPFRFRFRTALVRLTPIPSAVQQIFPENSGIGPKAASASQVGSAIPLAQLIGALWITGILVFLLYHGLRHARFIRLVKRWSERADRQQENETLNRIAREMGIKRPVGLRICSCVSSPMIIGFINPVVLLPRPDFSSQELPYIFRHELVHFSRKDLWYKSLVILATAIHWYNPVIYLMAGAVAAQCELSCDAEVVKGSGLEVRRCYSTVILQAIRCPVKLQTAFSTQFYGGKRSMKKRIRSIMDAEKKKAGIGILCMALVGTLCAGMAFSVDQNRGGGSDSARAGTVGKTQETSEYIGKITSDSTREGTVGGIEMWVAIKKTCADGEVVELVDPKKDAADERCAVLAKEGAAGEIFLAVKPTADGS